MLALVVQSESQSRTRWGNGQVRRTPQMTQLLDLQHRLAQDALNPETSPSVRAQIARAWCDLQEERRKLQMRPLPKAIDVQTLKRKTKNSGSGLAPSGDEPKE